MKKLFFLLSIFTFLSIQHLPIMAQVNYNGPLRVHVNSFYNYLEKGKKDKKYFKNCESKVKYLQGKDANLAAQLQAELNAAKGASAPPSPTPAKTTTSTAVNTSNNSAKTGTGDPFVDKAVKSFYGHLEKCKINEANYNKYRDDAERKIKYIAGKDAAKAAELQAEYDVVAGKWAAVAADNAANASTVRAFDGKFKFLKDNTPRSNYFDDEADQINKDLEAHIALYKACADEIVNDYAALLTEVQGKFIAGGSKAGRGGMMMMDRTPISYYPQFYGDYMQHTYYDRDISEIKTSMAALSGNGPEIAYNKILSMEAIYYAVKTVYPFEELFKTRHKELSDLLAASGGRVKAKARLAENGQRAIENHRMEKAQMKDAALEQAANNIFNANKPSTFGEPLRTNLLFFEWNVHRNELTGIPTYRAMVADVAAKDSKNGKIYVYRIIMRSNHDGTSWGKTYGYNVLPGGLELLPENLHK